MPMLEPIDILLLFVSMLDEMTLTWLSITKTVVTFTHEV